MWENPPVGFAGVVLLRKEVSTGGVDPIAKEEGLEAGILPIAGTWDSIHIFTVTPETAGGKAFRYHIDSNIMLRMSKGKESDPDAAVDPNLPEEQAPIPPGLGRVWLGGNLSKSVRVDPCRCRARKVTNTLVGRLTRSIQRRIPPHTLLIWVRWSRHKRTWCGRKSKCV